MREIGIKGRNIDIVLSDAVARCSMLPWQDQRLSPLQLRTYAHAYLQRAGMEINDEWSLDAGYRSFRAPGLAVAVPTKSLLDFIMVAERYKKRVRSATPVMAQGYWRYVPALRSPQCALLLCESSRLTLMRWEARKMHAFEVQPVGANIDVALKRLFQVQSDLPPTRLDVWGMQPNVVKPHIFAELFPETPIHLAGPFGESVK